MATLYPKFFKQPFRYMRWAAHEKPAFFWSVVIGLAGFPMLVVVPPIRRYFGDGPIEPIPITYPIPTGPRKIPSGYDD